MSAQDPQDQYLDASVPSASARTSTPASAVPSAPAPSAPAPSVRDLLAACAAARAVSTPPDDRAASARPAATRPPELSPEARPEMRPEMRPEEERAHRGSDRDAA